MTLPGQKSNGLRCQNAAGVRVPCGCSACTACTAGKPSYRVQLDGIQLNNQYGYFYTGTCPGVVTTFSDDYFLDNPDTFTRHDLCVVGGAASFEGECFWSCVRPLRDVEIGAEFTIGSATCDGGPAVTKGGGSGSPPPCDASLVVTILKTSDTTASVDAYIDLAGATFAIFHADVTTTKDDCLPLGTAIDNAITDWPNDGTVGSPVVNMASPTSGGAMGKLGTLTILDERCRCDETDCVYATANYGSATVVYFKNPDGTEAILPAGDYTVDYLCGALSYALPTSVFSINKDGTTGFRIVDGSGTVLATAPTTGGTATYSRQSAVEVGEAGATTSVSLSSPGKLGIKLVGVSDYTQLSLDPYDAAPAAPSFRACGVGTCPDDTDDAAIAELCDTMQVEVTGAYPDTGIVIPCPRGDGFSAPVSAYANDYNSAVETSHTEVAITCLDGATKVVVTYWNYTSNPNTETDPPTFTAIFYGPNYGPHGPPAGGSASNYTFNAGESSGTGASGCGFTITPDDCPP